MMQIDQVVVDIILLVLHNHEPLKKIEIEKDKIFVKVKGYDGNGMWIHQPEFEIKKLINKNKKKNSYKKFIEASILIPWAFIVSIAHFPDTDKLNFPDTFKLEIGF